MSHLAVSYRGHCAVCGGEGTFADDASRSPGSKLPCEHCGAVLRFRDEAHVLIDLYGRGRELSLDALVAAGLLDDLAVYYMGVAGPIRRRLAPLAGYHESAYDPALPAGVELAHRRTNQNTEALTFPDGCFDLVHSSHVMEHVADATAGFAEQARVLRPGGWMVCSVPTRFPLPEQTVLRAELVDDEVTHLKEPRYHSSPEGEGALVYRDFGADLAGLLEEVGFDVMMRRPHLAVDQARADLVVVGQRL